MSSPVSVEVSPSTQYYYLPSTMDSLENDICIPREEGQTDSLLPPSDASNDNSSYESQDGVTKKAPCDGDGSNDGEAFVPPPPPSSSPRCCSSPPLRWSGKIPVDLLLESSSSSEDEQEIKKKYGNVHEYYEQNIVRYIKKANIIQQQWNVIQQQRQQAKKELLAWAGTMWLVMQNATTSD